MYRCEAESVEGFIQQVAVSYVLQGYFHYVLCEIPQGKDPRAVDAKLIERYGLNISKWSRLRLRRKGKASVQYLRHKNVFVLLATEGEHEFFQLEATRKDIRVESLSCFGYEIRCYERPDETWHPSVRIGRSNFVALFSWCRKKAASLEKLEFEKHLREVPFAPFAPVRYQMIALLRMINRRRKRAGIPLISSNCIRRRRKPVKVYISAD